MLGGGGGVGSPPKEDPPKLAGADMGKEVRFVS